MRDEIDSLISFARSFGYITPAQKQIILTRAKQLDENVSNVEFSLEEIPFLEDELVGYSSSEVQKLIDKKMHKRNINIYAWAFIGGFIIAIILFVLFIIILL